MCNSNENIDNNNNNNNNNGNNVWRNNIKWLIMAERNEKWQCVCMANGLQYISRNVCGVSMCMYVCGHSYRNGQLSCVCVCGQWRVYL
jgi:hypothetical protein